MKKIVAILMLGVALVWADNALVLEEKCEANDAEACFKLNESDKIEKACDLGLAKACIKRVELYSNHPAYRKESLLYYTKACDLGDMEGCEGMLAEMSREGEEGEKRIELFKKYCLNDAVESICLRAAKNYDDRSEFMQKYLEIRSKKCDEGEVKECVSLGNTYLSGVLDGNWLGGISVDKNPTKAREFFQKACDAGDTYTCKKYELTQDTSKFKAILQKACDSGNQNACPKLGELYFSESKNTSKDKAKELYQKACDLGSANGCYELAVSYNIGRGVSQDINKAKELYKKACDLEKSSACENFKRLSK